jgi:hypothetical protein
VFERLIDSRGSDSSSRQECGGRKYTASSRTRAKASTGRAGEEPSTSILMAAVVAVRLRQWGTERWETTSRKDLEHTDSIVACERTTTLTC